ncbi:MAG: hypothetical protein IIZ19_04230 [Clostridia bacterium]|nr:hypothetical protein [Clostridia bacterium]
MSYIILSHKTYAPVKDYLKKRGHDVIEFHGAPSVSEPVRAHADMFVCRAGGRVFCAPEISPLLSAAGIEHTAGISPAREYPLDVPYNAFTADRYFVHSLKYTEKSLLSYVKEHGYELINVRQGYSKCSAAVTPGGVITADEGIFRALSGKVDVLKIREGHVSLPGFPYGFFGGCTGYAGGELIINGDLFSHPDGERIARFFREREVPFASFAGYPLSDVGSIIEL